MWFFRLSPDHTLFQERAKHDKMIRQRLSPLLGLRLADKPRKIRPDFVKFDSGSAILRRD